MATLQQNARRSWRFVPEKKLEKTNTYSEENNDVKTILEEFINFQTRAFFTSFTNTKFTKFMCLRMLSQ